MAVAQPTRSVHLYKNGDKFYSPKRVIVNFNQTRTLGAFLDNLTSREKPPYGAIRRLYTPTQGHIINSLDLLENNKFYVYSGHEKFVDLNYGKATVNNIRRRKLLIQKRIQPVGHSNIRVSAKCIKRQEGPKVVHVFRNGGDMSPAVRVLLHKNQMLSMVHILDHITSKVTLTSGAVRRLYHMSGKLVLDGSELENEQCYVAAGGEKFKKRGYNIQNLQQTSPRNKRVLPPVTRRPPPKAKPSPIREQQKPTHQPREPKPPPPKQEVPARRLPPKPAAQPEQKPKSRRPKPEKTAEQREAEAVFHHKPAIVKRSREKEEQPKESLDYEDPNSVFKATEQRKETARAAEVEENNETAVDLPIDQIAAEEVDEEVQEYESRNPLPPPPREATPPPPREATPPPPREATPPPPREAMPPLEPTPPPREATPPLEPTPPPREITPQLDPTPQPREATPPLEPTPPPHEATPPLEPTPPPREVTPPLDPTPPPREATPPLDPTPPPHEATPPLDPTPPPREATPPLDPTPPPDEATPPQQRTDEQVS